MSILIIGGVHPQQAPAKIDNALGAVGDELRFDLVKTNTTLGDKP